MSSQRNEEQAGGRTQVFPSHVHTGLLDLGYEIEEGFSRRALSGEEKRARWGKCARL